MARTNKVNESNSGEFRHRTTVGENGELLYDAPVIISDKADMKNYGITHDDCKYLHLGRSQRILVYFYKTPNRALAEYQWECLNNMHSSGYNSTRCVVPGTRKPFVKCPDTNILAQIRNPLKTRMSKSPLVLLISNSSGDLFCCILPMTCDIIQN